MIKLGQIKSDTPLLCASDDEGNSFNFVTNRPTPLLLHPEYNESMDVDQYVDANYKEIKAQYRERLLDSGKYSAVNLDEVDDGREDFVYQCMQEDSNYVFTCCIN